MRRNVTFLNKDRTSNQAKASRRKQLMRAIGGGLLPGQELQLPNGKPMNYDGHYNINPGAKTVTFHTYSSVDGNSSKIRKMPATALIGGREFKLSFSVGEKTPHDVPPRSYRNYY